MVSSQQPSISLIVQRGPNPGQLFQIQDHPQTIGWSPDNDIVVADKSLSPEHARITPTGSGFIIEDLNSTTGTYKNGQRITRPTFLRRGDTLQLGQIITFKVYADQPDQDIVQTVAPSVTSVSAGQPRIQRTAPPPQPGPIYPPPTQGRSSPWLWVGSGVIVTLLLIGGVLATLYFTNLFPNRFPITMAQTPENEVVRLQPTPTSTSTPIPTRGSSPTSTTMPSLSPTQEIVVTVPGIPAAALEERQMPQNIGRVINPFCNGKIEVMANEPILISWQQRVTADYLTRWLESLYYDAYLDSISITDRGPLYYYRGESCGEDGLCDPTLTWWTNVGLLDIGPHHVMLDWYTIRAVSDGFDQAPADGELDSYGPGQVGSGFCDIVVVEVPTPTFTPMPTPTLTSTPRPTATPRPAFGPGVFQDFETASSWRRGDQPYGEFTRSTAQVHSGSFAGQLTYNFPGVADDFVVFRQTRPLDGRPSAISAWIYGDASGNFFNVWILDAQGEIWSMHSGEIRHSGWQQMTARLDENRTWPSGHIGGPGNGRIDYPISFYALVLDNIPDGSGGQGTIYIDDLESQ